MAGSSVTQRVSEDQTARSIDWEEECYREGCAYARAQAKHRLSALDDELLGDKPTGWTVLGFRERTLVTRFGDVVVRRRMCRDDAGQTRYRLDEALMWKPYQQASPSLTESIVSMASLMPPYQVRGRLFRMVDEMVSYLTAGVLSR